MKVDSNLDIGIINIFVGRKVIQIKTPNCHPLFSERYGYKKPLFKLFGYRVFVSTGQTT